MVYSADDILKAREKRVEIRNCLMKRFNLPTIEVKVNYPGLSKENKVTSDIIKSMDTLISDILFSKIYFKSLRFTAEGPILTLVVDKDPIEIKKITTDIEEKHTLGRILDIDVYDLHGKAISRVALGYAERKCFLCNRPAFECIRSSAHSECEIVNYIMKKYGEFLWADS